MKTYYECGCYAIENHLYMCNAHASRMHCQHSHIDNIKWAHKDGKK